MCQVSGVMCQVSYVTCHIFFSFFWQSGRISRWRVCCQQVLPLLVYLLNQPFGPYQSNICHVWLSVCFSFRLSVPLKNSHFQMLKKVFVKDCIPNFTVPASAGQLLLYSMAQLAGLGMTQFAKKKASMFFFEKNNC